MMMSLQTLTNASQNFDAFCRIWLGNANWLEPSFERSVFLNVTAVLLQRRGADDLQRIPAQSRLENVCGVDRSLCGPRPDNVVELVNKQDYISALLHLMKHRLHALLKISPVFCPCDHCGQIQTDKSFRAQILRNIPLADSLCERLCHGGFSDARLTDQDRIVFAST